VAFNAEKFGRAVQYVIWKAGNRPNFGAVKLNKVLWFAEARVYVLHRHHMTGESFEKGQFGPVPKHIMQTRETLKKSGSIEVWDDRGQTKFRAKAVPDMADFTPEEMKQLNHWIEVIDQDHTAASISDKTHDYGWEIAEMGEEIPLYAILAERVRHPKGNELEWARKVAARLGLA
jgi:uncharacterized phage-associated protein